MIDFRQLNRSELEELKLEGIEVIVSGYSLIKDRSPDEINTFWNNHFNEMVEKAWGSEHEYFLAITDLNTKDVVGSLWYRVPNDEMFSDMVFLSWFGIYEPYRRKGYGKAAIEKLKSNLKTKGIRRLVLETFSSNEVAVAFYTSMGFSPTRIVMQSMCDDH